MVRLRQLSTEEEGGTTEEQRDRVELLETLNAIIGRGRQLQAVQREYTARGSQTERQQAEEQRLAHEYRNSLRMATQCMGRGNEKRARQQSAWLGVPDDRERDHTSTNLRIQGLRPGPTDHRRDRFSSPANNN